MSSHQTAKYCNLEDIKGKTQSSYDCRIHKFTVSLIDLIGSVKILNVLNLGFYPEVPVIITVVRVK